MDKIYLFFSQVQNNDKKKLKLKKNKQRWLLRFVFLPRDKTSLAAKKVVGQDKKITY